jgi:hypothetical protein
MISGRVAHTPVAAARLQAFTGVALFARRVMAMSGWLFIRGVDDVKWRERAAGGNPIWR